ncbi:DUF2867 domain-containing protein [Acidisoma silvae]|uniref:DUF2867 domain-containing protein n=2 Tax=Acidisoma silvae TaxID=2802396 RepID=A0A963YWY3_9PROT|nr:DUF2867 domain-containing protein [Acidisoma silvae]
MLHGIVRRTGLPRDSELALRYRNADLADAFCVLLPADAEGIDVLADRVFGHPGPVFRTALGLRDAAIGLFGVKTSGQLRKRLARDGVDRIDFFPVLSRSAREVVLGEDDRHLDFRTSLLLRQATAGKELVATTVVHCHNTLGRTYLAAILLGHELVVRSVLKRALDRG